MCAYIKNIYNERESKNKNHMMDLWVWFILNMLISSSSRLLLSLSKDIRIKKRERPRWTFFMLH